MDHQEFILNQRSQGKFPKLRSMSAKSSASLNVDQKRQPADVSKDRSDSERSTLSTTTDLQELVNALDLNHELDFVDLSSKIVVHGHDAFWRVPKQSLSSEVAGGATLASIPNEVSLQNGVREASGYSSSLRYHSTPADHGEKKQERDSQTNPLERQPSSFLEPCCTPEHSMDSKEIDGLDIDHRDLEAYHNVPNPLTYRHTIPNALCVNPLEEGHSGTVTCSIYCDRDESSQPKHGHFFADSNQAFQCSIAQYLPNEIIQQVYTYLSPIDYNSARHTCRSWFINSLERSLIDTMLRRGGWKRNATRYLLCHSSLNICDEWMLSKIIARECALSSYWKGNGLDGIGPSIPAATAISPFRLSSTWKFGYPSSRQSNKTQFSRDTIFVTSLCGRFLMVAYDCILFVYKFYQPSPTKCAKSTSAVSETCGKALQPITRITCPRKVITCSMDSSYGRFAVAVLMEGRMGLVSNITSEILNAVESQASATLTVSGSAGAIGSQAPEQICDYLGHSSSEVRHARQQVTLSSVYCQGTGDDGLSVRHMFFKPTDLESLPSIISEECNHRLGTDRFKGYMESIPQERSMPTIYHALCSADDPPRSIAICPQRRCVAFGCLSGIELHWSDALTGQNLNRWFPLNSPSDYLHFLPPRKVTDNGKRLRLISSAARPGIENNGRVGSGRPLHSGFNSDAQSINTTTSNPFMPRSLPFDGKVWNEEAPIRRATTGSSARSVREDSDHYKAVPLSDGIHILFTDPGTGFLCLGSDSPFGGPTKLFRKFWFKGPEIGSSTPLLYASGVDLAWGLRVIAVFEEMGLENSLPKQSLWLFSVPTDALEDSQTDMGRFAVPEGSSYSYETQRSLSGSSFKGRSADSIGPRIADWMRWWPDESLSEWIEQPPASTHGLARCKTPWPIQVKGQRISDCHDIVDLTIDSGTSETTIWIFERDGTAKVFQFEDGKDCDSGVQRHFVTDDGSIRMEDTSGDVDMYDAKTFAPIYPGTRALDRSFDGADSSGFYAVKPVPTSMSDHGHGKSEQWMIDPEESEQLTPEDAQGSKPKSWTSEIFAANDLVSQSWVSVREICFENDDESKHCIPESDEPTDKYLGITKVVIDFVDGQ